jgi:hypothetical protein
MFSPLRVLACVLALVLGGQIVIAQQFASPDSESGLKVPRSDGPGGGPYIKAKINFDDVDRLTIHNYYNEIAQRGSCPAGLTRHPDGCLSQNPAKEWVIGRQLPYEAVFHDLPAELTRHIAPAPAGYRYVRIGSDVLLISRGSDIVVAAVVDLARL